MSPYTPFWMVYGAGQSAPTVRHKTRESAVKEAKRLARHNHDVEFFVLEATHHVVKRDVDVTLIDPDFPEFVTGQPGGDCIPF